MDLVLLINDEADELLTSLSSKVMSESYDPAVLPDQTITFEYVSILFVCLKSIFVYNNLTCVYYEIVYLFASLTNDLNLILETFSIT